MAAPLSPEDLNALQEDGVLIPTTQAGKRKISASFILTPPSSGGSSAASTLSTKSTASVRYCDTESRQDIPDFPDNQESAAALEYIGLEPSTAERIFARWQSRPDPDQNPDDLFDYVHSHVSQLKKTSWQDYSDAQILERLGVAPWLRKVLLNPRFKDIYETETLRHWLVETFRANYRSIETTLQRLKTYLEVRKTKRKTKKQKRASIIDAFQSPPDEASSDPATLAQHVATMSLASGSDHFPQAHICIGAAEPVLPEHKIFFKATAVEEMSENDMFIAEDGSINMRAIRTYPGGDFNAVDDAWYWTAEYETAVKYRDWAVGRLRSREVVIIRIQVPISFVQTLRQEELWYSPDWKEYVWDIPSKFTKYWKEGPEQTDTMLGHICTGLSPRVSKIRANQVQTTIDNDKVLKIGDRKATQWVVMHEDVADKLALQVRGKMHIDIFSATEPKDQEESHSQGV